MAQRQQESLGVADWESEQLRVTTFHPSSIETRDLVGRWERIVGDSPEQEITRSKEGITELSGAFEGKRLVVVSQAGRVNLLLLPGTHQSMQPPNGFLTLGPFSAALNTFLKIANDWLDANQPIVRLAFGSVLLRSVPDLDSGHQYFSDVIKSVRLDQSEISDFFYQINRPRLSSITQGMQNNRLSKWSMIQGGGVEVAISPTEIKRRNLDAQLACRLELDINTMATRTIPIPPEHIPDLFAELVGYGVEIAERGDIP